MAKRWCTKCGTDPAWWLWRSGVHVGCGGRVIPIATICDPPEPTVIDESDLAPGMVVAITDIDGDWLCTPDVHLSDDGIAWALRMDSTEDARWVAESTLPRWQGC